MFGRRTVLTLALCVASGCSSADSTNFSGAGAASAIPAVGAASSAGAAASGATISASAHRALVPKAAVQRDVATSSGATTSPFHLSAFPAPLSAFPAIGQPSIAGSQALCGSSGKKDKAASCPVKIRTDVGAQAASTPVQLLQGLLPGSIQEIYDLPALDATAGLGRTVAIVVAYDDPVAEADLAVYRNAFGMTPCTTADGCFQKLAQDGTTNYPRLDAGWAVETATDLDAVSALCPGCRLLVVEAASSNIPDLARAVDLAAARGATVISNSYGVPEAADNVQYDSHYDHPGVAIVAAAGDQGYGVMFPASSEYVTAVGGTSLYQNAGGISESAWPLTSSGCSAYIKKPSWQHDTGCPRRTMNDVAVVADPATGLAVYDSILYGTSGGWTVVGGTSIGAPIVSAIIATARHPEHYAGAQQFYLTKQKAFFNITAGSNGTCATTYFCSAGPGYNAPTGLGSPSGNKAFDA